MPNFLNRFKLPRRSTEHRVAAIALYRALLRQCASTPLDDEARTALQNVVRNRFKKNEHIHSHNKLRIYFHAGYEAIDLLDGSVAGDGESTARIKDYLTRIPEELKTTPMKQPPKAYREAQRGKKQRNPPLPDPTESTACPPPEFSELSQRPRPHSALGGSGIRRVPKLVNANGIPILRLKKPQPASLSRIIRQKLNVRTRRVETRNFCQRELLPLLEQEDKWDQTLLSVIPDKAVARDIQRGENWVYEIEEYLKQSETLHRSSLYRNKEVADRMFDIVRQEQVLAKQEKMMRQRKARWLRQAKEQNGPGLG
jgi:hypothetical protein